MYLSLADVTMLLEGKNTKKCLVFSRIVEEAII
ncbi:hypothetical protein AsAng_0024340 [Aureispira anguillae]|uniref:Uncharacterized protein n=1 Tax=Aureispira anguillae TaxID=2864201 RepID=A0A915YEM2_9BACT|nr:hypothetical protein AsAng_0024340 [Aureispira anguillae]